jgi:hypothetical protein
MADARRTLRECVDFTRGSYPAAPDHDATFASRTERLEEEQRRLIEWAKENGKLGHRRLQAELSRGGEHRVYYQRSKRRYLKETLPNRHKGFGIALGSVTHGAVPSEYLERLLLQNEIFNDDIRLERVVHTDDKPVIIISQPAIKGLPPSQDALDAMMREKGYEIIGEEAYYDGRDGLLIFDLAPRNAVQVRSGVIYPIDPVIQRVTAEFVDFLRSNPARINAR